MQNLRLAVRSFLKRPAFFALVVAVIAIGVGANTAIFSVVDAVLLRPLPYAEPDRLVFLLGMSNGRSGSISILDFRDVVDRSRSIESAALYGASPSTLSGPSDAEPLAAFRVSPSLFAVLRVPAAYGRVFDDSTDGAGAAMILSDRLWRRRFGGDPRIVGRTVRVNGAPRTVVGVMPAGFAFPERAEAWVPLEPTSDELRPNNRGAHFLSAVARVKPGVSFAQAQHEVEAIGEALARDYPATNRDRSTTLAPAAERLVESSRPALRFLSGAVGCVLLIACANVSNLLLVRATSRRREIAMRLALGASRAQIVRALLAESLVVAVAAAVAGLLLGAWVVRAAVALVPQDLPHAQQIAINARVLAFAALLSLVATVACGAVPALIATEGAIADVIREGRSAETDRGRARRLFVVAEVALALMLLVGAGVSIRSVHALTFRTWLLASFAAVALVLAVIGLYAVIAYSVAQRTREIGVRMALGADAEQVLRLVLRDGMPPVMVGAALGLAGALALSRFVSSLVVAIPAHDPATLAGVTALLVGAALAACYVPARRAIRVNPVVALRVE